MPGLPEIAIAGLGKTYATHAGAQIHAMGPVSLEIWPEEFVCVVGRSGCGKSTLLRIIAGLVAHTSGALDYPRQRLAGRWLQASIGMVFQEAVLLPWRTVTENILLPSEILGIPAAEAKRRAARLLHMVGLEEFAGKYPQELSGGMQQRVSIARALLSDPDILLMDEPFGALDALTREAMSLELMKICDGAGKTVIFVTHSIIEAVLLASRVVVMSSRPGRIVDVVPIDLPRPRSLDMVSSTAFGDHARRIRTLLDAPVPAHA